MLEYMTQSDRNVENVCIVVYFTTITLRCKQNIKAKKEIMLYYITQIRTCLKEE